MIKNWYVYRHIRLDKNIPFYIGIGNKKFFYRAFEFDFKKRNKIWSNIYKKTNIKVEIIFDNLSKEEAKIKEQEFIKLYGRLDLKTGTLCNLTDGGDGIWNCKISEQTKLKLSKQKLGEKNPQFGKKQSPETIQKKINSLKGQKRNELTKQKQSLSSIKSGQAKKTLVYNFETKELIGVYHSLSEACRNVNLNPQKYSGKACQVASGKRSHCKNYIFKYI